jgi:hypothetical protein
MSILKVENILTQEELALIKNAVEQNEIEPDETLGRKYMGGIHHAFTPEIEAKMYAIANQASEVPLSMTHGMVVEYSAEYGTPNLPPHFDGDTNDLIINMQLEANTSWDLGLNLETYSLEDNSALVFNANTEIHWRVNKDFKPGEYVRMMFVRFYDAENPSDYSHLSQHWPSHDIFKEIREFRDSLETA